MDKTTPPDCDECGTRTTGLFESWFSKWKKKAFGSLSNFSMAHGAVEARPYEIQYQRYLLELCATFRTIYDTDNIRHDAVQGFSRSKFPYSSEFRLPDARPGCIAQGIHSSLVVLLTAPRFNLQENRGYARNSSGHLQSAGGSQAGLLSLRLNPIFTLR